MQLHHLVNTGYQIDHSVTRICRNLIE